MSWKRSWRFACASCARDWSREVVIYGHATGHFCRDLEAFFVVRGVCVKAFFTRSRSTSTDSRDVRAAEAMTPLSLAAAVSGLVATVATPFVIARSEATKQSISLHVVRWIVLLHASLHKEEFTSPLPRARGGRIDSPVRQRERVCARILAAGSARAELQLDPLS